MKNVFISGAQILEQSYNYLDDLNPNAFEEAYDELEN